MSTIDERIVQMRFNNREFESGVKTTMDSLAGLKKGLNLDGATKGLNDLGAAGKRFSLASIAEGVEGISSKFTALGILGVTTLANLANRAVNAGVSIAKSLTIDPIKSGLEEYETQLNSVQTILANTASKGSTLKDVNGALNELNTYADKTIYNFTEMTRNIGTFTAAGVDLKTSTAAIKGIANLAAVSGSNAQQASTAMYQLSQAMATGTVKLMDWNSVVNAGMGGQVFQDALKETARASGVQIDAIIKKQGSFRDSLQKGWLTTEILTKTLSKFTGDLSEKQLKQQGYTKEQIKEIIKLGKMANDAATKVKTFSQLMDTLKEAVGSGWAQTWQIVFGNFTQAKKLWTSVSDTLGGMINASSNARNNLLKDWAKLGGRKAIIESVKNVFEALMAVIKPIKDAFRDIFPPVTAKQLAEMSKNLQKFTQNLKIGSDTADLLKRTFKGVFAIFDIGIQIIKGIFSAIKPLFSEMKNGSGGILDFTAKIGDWLVALDESIKKGEGFKNFFTKIGETLSGAIQSLKDFATWVKAALGKGTEDASATADAALSRISDRFKPVVDALKSAFSGIADGLGKAWDFAQPILSAIGEKLGQVGSAIKDGLAKADYSKVLDTINTGLFAGLVLIIKKFTSGGLTGLVQVNAGGGLFDSIKSTFGALTDTLKGMQQNLKANILLKIAAAIGIMAASAIALSLVDSEKLTKALGAMSVMFAQLLFSMSIFSKMSGAGGFAKLPIVAGTLVILATAIGILATSVKKLSELSWEELAKGLGAVTVLIGALVGATQLMSSNLKNLLSAAIGLGAIAIAIKILASAVKDFAEMDWKTMAAGFAGVGTALVSLAIFTRIADVSKMGLKSGAGLLLLAASLKVIASAVQDFAGMDWSTLGRGMAGMAASLLVVAGAMQIMPKNMLVSAASLVIVGAALQIIGNVMMNLSGLSWEELAKGLAAIAASLLIIAGAMALMTGALPGAAALVIVAGALTLLVPVIVALSALSWAALGMAMAALAAALLTFAAASLLLAPAIPVMLGVAAAVALLGVGLLAIGAAVLAFATGLTALATLGAAGALAITALVTGIVALIPIAMKALAQGIVSFANVIAKSGPTFVNAMTTLIMSLLTSINKVAPKIIDTLVNLVMKLVTAITTAYPKFVKAGLGMIKNVLQGIADNIGGIVKAATNIVVNFLNGLADSLPKIIKAGVNLIKKFIEGIANAGVELANAAGDAIVTFLQGIADAIRTHSAEINQAGLDIGKAIVDGMKNGITSGASSAVEAAKGMARSALEGVKNILGIHSPSREFKALGKFTAKGFADGLTEGTASDVKQAYSTMKQMLKDTISATSDDVDRAKEKLKKLTDARKKDADAIAKAKKEVEKATSENERAEKAYKKLTKSLDDNRDRLVKKAKEHDQVIQDIKEERQALIDAKKARDDYKQSIKDQYSQLPDFVGGKTMDAAVQKAQSNYDSVAAKAQTAAQALADANQKMKDGAKAIHDQYDQLPDITETTTVEDYVAKLKSDREALVKFTKDLGTLRSMGLDDETYNQLLSKGVSIQPFIDSLVQGGPAAVAQIDSLNNQLDEAAKQLGDTTSQTLYQSGVDAAKAASDGMAAELQKANANLSKASAVTVANYITDLKAQTAATKKYRDDLQKLRDQGLNDDTYKKLLADGVGDQAFVTALLASGKSGINQVNTETKNLVSAASSLGSQGAKELYQAAVDSARGLLKGLKDNEKEIQAAMDRIGLGMVKAIKKALGIKSPSRELAAVGKWTNEGLIVGLNKTADSVAKTSAAVGDTALAAMKNSLSNISAIATNELDMDPTIRPVLDLSSVKKSSGLISGMINGSSVSVDTSYNRASSIAIDRRVDQEESAASERMVTQSVPTVIFQQTNNSPESLSTADIYRQTKNLISTAKGALPS